MSTFIGRYDAKADVKGRIFIPSVYRHTLAEGDRERVVMRMDTHNECLVIYPQSVWNKMLDDLKSRLDEWDPQDQRLLMQFVSAAEWLEVDSQGRVLITKKYLQAIGVDNSDVLFVGMIDRFALWSKARYEKELISPADFAAQLQERMMRPKKQSE